MAKKKIIIWDWDGVIVDSIGYKYEGIWKDVFPNDTVKQKSIADFLKTPEGKAVNRYGLIRHALVETGEEELKGISESELKKHPLIKKYGDIYGDAAKSGVVKIGMFDGANEALRTLFKNGNNMYVVSGGGNDNDLTEIAIELGVADFFKGIFGFGNTRMPLVSFGKYENFERVSKLEGTKEPEDYVVIGDGASDHNLATEIGCDFIGIPNKWNKWEDDEEMKPMLVNNFKELLSRITELSK